MPFHGKGPPGQKGRTPPPAETSEEAAYLKALGEKQKLVSIKLADGEVVRGWIEYYDKNMVRLTREGQPNLFIFKHEIMYIAEDAPIFLSSNTKLCTSLKTRLGESRFSRLLGFPGKLFGQEHLGRHENKSF